MGFNSGFKGLNIQIAIPKSEPFFEVLGLSQPTQTSGFGGRRPFARTRENVHIHKDRIVRARTGSQAGVILRPFNILRAGDADLRF